MLRAVLAEQQQQPGLIMFNPSQEVGQQQMVAVAPPVIGRASSACAQSSATSNTGQPYLVDATTSITTCLLLYPVGKARKTKEIARARVHPTRDLLIIIISCCSQNYKYT